jgi:hypothetical protein
VSAGVEVVVFAVFGFVVVLVIAFFVLVMAFVPYFVVVPDRRRLRGGLRGLQTLRRRNRSASRCPPGRRGEVSPAFPST